MIFFLTETQPVAAPYHRDFGSIFPSACGAAAGIIVSFAVFFLTGVQTVVMTSVRHFGPYIYDLRTPVPEGPPPPSFHWGEVDGVNYLTQAKNQHIPQVRSSPFSA